MSLLINIPNRPIEKLIAKLEEILGKAEVEIWPNVSDVNQVEMALTWNHEHGSLRNFPNLKGIHSFGAGVDAILEDPLLPDVPVTRIVDPMIGEYMQEYVSGIIYQHKLRLNEYKEKQNTCVWKPRSARKPNTVSILGMGQIGQVVAARLFLLGFNVLGWSQSAKSLPNISCFCEQDGFDHVVKEADYLVCLLPLTQDTSDILNKDTFAKMKDTSVVINVARGGHVNESELIKALDSGEIAHVYLDVFKQEPLPDEHPFWQHQNISITPHVSALTHLDTAVEQIVTNYHRIKSSKLMLNTIDKHRGY